MVDLPGAGQGVFGELGSGLASRMFGSILWFGLIVFLVLVFGFLGWWFFIHKKRFDIKVKMISNRADERYSILFDKAAILDDRKTNTQYFRIWALKRDFPVPKYNVLQKTNEGDYLEIFRKSENEFYFLRPSVINKTKVIKSDGKLYSVAEQDQIMVDPEMGFWAAKRKDLNKKMFNTESMLMKILPYVPHMIAGVILIFVLYILMDNLPGILTELRSLVVEMRTLRTAQVVTG